MPASYKRNSLLVLGLAILFFWAFMFAKHDPALRGVIPFGDDPYDAVGSCAVLIGMWVAGISIVRAILVFRREAPTERETVYLIRCQIAVVLMVLIAALIDFVAMLRHPGMWLGSPTRTELVGMMTGLALLAMAVWYAIRVSWRNQPGKISTAGIVAIILPIAIFFVYPEHFVQNFTLHLLTVVFADCMLFIPMRVLLPVLVPDVESNAVSLPKADSWNMSASKRWGIVLVLGILMGAVVFLGELREQSGSMPFLRFSVIATVFVGLGAAALLLAYLFLGKILGLGAEA